MCAFIVGALILSACASTTPRAATVVPPVGSVERGNASWYGEEFANRPTANGEIFIPSKLTAAHRTLPLGTVADVTNERNGRTVRVRVNDRGPFIAGRVLDLSKGAAEELDAVRAGVVPVSIAIVSLGDNKYRREAPPGTDEDPTASTWAVQAGAFGSEENAVAFRARLADAGYPNPWIEEYQGLRRVKFGPYAGRAKAEEARDSLDALGLAGVLVAYR